MTVAKKILISGPLAVALVIMPVSLSAADEKPADVQQDVRHLQPDKTFKKAQKKLRKAGHYDGKVDGVSGPETAEAVREFQRSKGLPETGQLDARTLDALGIKNEAASSADKEDGPLVDAAQATERTAEKAASATEKGVKKAASTTEKGVRKAGEETGEGLQKAGAAVEDTFDKDKTKAEQRADEVSLTAAETREVQGKLSEMGYYKGKADGVVGADTEEAIRKFQKAKNLPVTGRLDTRTRAELGVK